MYQTFLQEQMLVSWLVDQLHSLEEFKVTPFKTAGEEILGKVSASPLLESS